MSKAAIIIGVAVFFIFLIILYYYYYSSSSSSAVASTTSSSPAAAPSSASVSVPANTVMLPATTPAGQPAAVGVTVATSGTPVQQAAQVAATQAAVNAGQLPAGITNGQIVRCSATGAIYQIVNGQKQWYPNMTVYQKYGSPAWTYGDSSANCATLAGIPSGPNFAERMTGKPVPKYNQAAMTSMFH